MCIRDRCQTAISVRYPAVELATGALFFFCAWRWGLTPVALAWCGFAAALLTLALIDWDTTLLPDDITLPLLWAGLIAAALGLSHVPLADSLWGAVGGYLSLWLVYWGFKLATGKEGMGYGDFKLLGALGAWLGWQGVLLTFLAGSFVGALVGLTMAARGRADRLTALPYGVFLAPAAAAMVFWGRPIWSWYLAL